MTKISSSKSKAAIINSYFSTSYMQLVIGKTLTMIYNIYHNVWFVNMTPTLLKVRKKISRPTIMLISVNKNIFWKKRDFSSLLSSKRKAITMSKNLKPISDNLWCANVGFADVKTQFPCKTWLHYVDFVTKIEKFFNQMLP